MVKTSGTLRKRLEAKMFFCVLFGKCKKNGNRMTLCMGERSPMSGVFYCPHGKRYCCALCPDLDRCEDYCNGQNSEEDKRNL